MGIRNRSTKYDGKAIPGSDGVAMASLFKFEKKGKSGIEVSEVFPKLGELVDDLCVVRSCHTDIPAHEVATVFMNTGSTRQRAPVWLVGALRFGHRKPNMPGYVSLRPAAASRWQRANWQARFSPANTKASASTPKSPWWIG